MVYKTVAMYPVMQELLYRGRFNSVKWCAGQKGCSGGTIYIGASGKDRV